MAAISRNSAIFEAELRQGRGGGVTKMLHHIDLFAGIGGFSLAIDTVFHEQTMTVNGNYNRKGASKKSGNGLATALLSLADFPASRSATPDEEKERTTTAISGRKCLQLYETPNRTGSSLKTCVALLLGTTAWYSKQCVLTWKAKTTKSNRLLFQLAPSKRRTDGTGYGLLPTATLGGFDDTNERALKKKQLHAVVAYQMKMLKTPGASEAEGGVMEIRPGTDAKYKMRDQVVHALGGKNTGMKLQPGFVAWMMGFPEDWCDFPTVPKSVTPAGERKR